MNPCRVHIMSPISAWLLLSGHLIIPISYLVENEAGTSHGLEHIGAEETCNCRSPFSKKIDFFWINPWQVLPKSWESIQARYHLSFSSKPKYIFSERALQTTKKLSSLSAPRNSIAPTTHPCDKETRILAALGRLSFVA